MTQAERFVDAFSHEQRRVMGIAKRSVGDGLDRRAAARRADPGRGGDRRRRDRRRPPPACWPRPASPCQPADDPALALGPVPHPDRAAGRHEGRRPSGRGQAQRRLRGRHRLRAGAATTTATASPPAPCACRCRSTCAPRPPRTWPATSSPRPASPCRSRWSTPSHRMKVVRDLVGRARAEPALALTEPLAGVLNRLRPT